MKIATATLKERYPLTTASSTKTTYHVRLDLGSTNICFKPGDSLAIYAQNDPILVDAIIEALGAKGDECVKEKRSNEEMSLRTFLTHKAHLTRTTSHMLTLAYEFETDHDRKNRLHHLLDPIRMKHYLSIHEPLDLFKEYPGLPFPLQELCHCFSPLLPRFYSVASSASVDPSCVDLTVALLSYSHSGVKRYGVAGYFLCHLAKEQSTPIPFYVQPARRFALPIDPHASIIMVGPGTGVAPFRAFMQERIHLNSKGKSWLFFGERHRASDFLYEEYWQMLVSQKALRLSTAFSRDQENKIYVQDRMQEEPAELFHWLQEGAYFYVCGDAKEMAKAVDQALHQIVLTQGQLNEEKTKEYVKNLKKEGRYLVDVY